MLTLYSTWGCHLCEEAEALLRAAGLEFTLVDIVDDPVAFALYRTEIPVLIRQQHGQTYELKWPFDAVALQILMTQPAL
ncbi:MAG: glutaredoxin family protein [Rheinheimera sp.]|nr:MAG: glutaredoxin family protein [Rheinheimera sp.]